MNDLVLRLMQAASRPRRRAKSFGTTGRRPPTVAQRLRRRQKARARYRSNPAKERLKQQRYRRRRKYGKTRRGPHRKWTFLPSSFKHLNPTHPPAHHGIRPRPRAHHRPVRPTRPRVFIPHRPS